MDDLNVIKKNSHFIYFFYSFDSFFLYTTQTGVPDKTGGYEAFYGFSGNFMKFDIPVVIWHVENMQLHKLITQHRHATHWLRSKTFFKSKLILDSYLAACRASV